MDDREKLLDKIRELEFATLDLSIFLDNFPENKKALSDFNTFSNQLMKSIREYELNFGALFNFGFSESPYPWTWINEPWPWEYDM